jgi:hypothetical protein
MKVKSIQFYNTKNHISNIKKDRTFVVKIGYKTTDYKQQITNNRL